MFFECLKFENKVGCSLPDFGRTNIGDGGMVRRSPLKEQDLGFNTLMETNWSGTNEEDMHTPFFCSRFKFYAFNLRGNTNSTQHFT